MVGLVLGCGISFVIFYFDRTIKSVEQVEQKIKLPTGYTIVYGGAYAEQQQSFKELLIILVLLKKIQVTLFLE